MIDKKQTGGLEDDNKDIITPSDNQLLNTNNLIDTVNSKQPITVNGTSGLDLLTDLQDIGFDPSRTTFNTIDKDAFSEYERLIDGPFSLMDSNIDDRRADGQSFGEKALYGIGKFFPKTAAHIVGSTVGLVDGFTEVAKDAYVNGMSASNWNKFFNNDFQRSLDSFNEAVDKKLPNYYHSQEQNLNFMQSVFGKGAANFWTNDFSNGLSFVAGAVLSEMATAGTAKFLMPAKAANKLKGIAAIRNTSYGQKAIQANKNLQRINRAERIYDGLTTGRRLLTGAFYESGVEARHNYDHIVEKLSAMHVERGLTITPEDQAKIHDVAVRVSNGVFAGNAALVGYSNMLMFRRIFGSGLTKNKKFKNKITETADGKYKAKHKDWGNARMRLHKYGWIARRPLYEGFVEEGGQKTLDIAGQYAAEDMYLDDKDPGQMQAIGELMEHTFDGMAEAYGSTEGQKEIFLGVVLAALGLPSFIHTNEKGEKSFKIGYGKTGGLMDFMSQYKEGQQEVEDVVDYMNNNPDALESIKNNFDMLMGVKRADDERDMADATNNDFAYKNSDHDAFFAFVYSRLRGGYFGDVIQSLEDIKDMDLDSFEAMFNYEEQTQDMSKQERESFLSERKNTVIESHKERAHKIKEIYESLDNTKIDSKGKKVIAQALSSTNDLDGREEALINEIGEYLGGPLTAIITDKEENDKQANNNILNKVKNFVMDKLPPKVKKVLETSETGQEVKREIGIKEFTEPGHPALVYMRMMNKLAQLKKQQAAHEQNDDVDGYIEVTEKIEALEDEMAILNKGIVNKTAPDISPEEKQLLEEYKKKDPAGYELNKDEIIKKLQDLRRIRAKRHQMLNLVQQLLDPDAANDKIQRMEEVVQDILTEEERKSLPPEEQRLTRKYKGKILEFEYTDKNGVTRTHRVLFEDSNNLIKLPNEETFKLLQRKKALLSQKYKTEDEQAELDLIEEELKKSTHVQQNSKPFTIGILNKANNITVMTEQELVLKQLKAVTSVLQDSLAEELKKAHEDIAASKEKIINISKQIKDIKIAIKNAKTNKKGDLRVNLNSISKGTQNKVETALALIAELKEEERGYKDLLVRFTADIQTLNDNASRIQLIHSALSNPEAVSKILDKSATRQDVFQFISDSLGLTSIEEFYQKLGEEGFFDLNSLTEIAGQKNKDGGYDVDEEILEEILNLTNNSISKEYLDLMNTDLEHFRNELELLTKHRSDVEKMLNRMLTPEGEIMLFPPDGLTEDELPYLTYQLNAVDQDIATIQSIINMLEAEVEQNLLDATNSDLIQNRVKAIQTQSQINDMFIEYENWLASVAAEPVEEAEDKEGDSVFTEEQNEDLQNQADQTNSPSFSSVGWTKTAGNHNAALNRYTSYYKPKIDNGENLTEAEQLELQHIESQLRFFRKSYEIFDYSKKTGAKLLVVTRSNIRDEWKDKIVFYDIQKAQSSGRYDDPANYTYVDNLTENSENIEELEDIKLVLVDANNNPILLDGEIVYTSMNSSSETTLTGRFKGQEGQDLDKDGNLNEGLPEAQSAFKVLRMSLLADNKERFLYIKSKSKGLVMPSNEGSKPGIGRLQIKKGKGNKGFKTAKEEDLKDMRLTLALPAKGTKGANQMVELFGFSVPSRFAYFGTNNNGYMGTNNLVPALISTLSEGQVNNIYNLSRYFAENDKDGINIGGKGFTTILKEQIFYGERSKEREQKQFSIYLQDDAIYFGDNKISLEQLKNPSKFADIHEEYKTFLRTLYFNINSTSLNKDLKARTEAQKKGNKTGAYVAPVYTTFNEVIVNDDLSTEVKEWDNYTHYLLSDVGRNEADVPVKVNMPLATTSNVDQRFTPQFKNVYFNHSSEAYTEDNLPTNQEQFEAPEIDTKKERKFIELTDKDGNKFTVELETDKDIQKGVIREEASDKVDDTLDDTPFSQSGENVEGPFFLLNMQQPSTDLDLNKELEWFNANMPKDSNGNPIVGIDIVQGLIDGKAFGKFTKHGNILLSNLLNTPGIIYHESWHAITRRFISPDQRFAMYDEVRGMRGSTTTYKGETKKMSQLTDKEADEWLAEEFREYVLAGGNYKVGSKIQKSIFDKILSILDFFINNTSQAQDLMSKINTGYFSNPNTNITIYDSKTEAYYEGTRLTATMRNNTMEGMTVLLFHKGLKSGIFNLEDFVDPEKTAQRNKAIRSLYGKPEILGSVYSQIEAHIKEQIKQAKSQRDIDNLEQTMRAIKDNWQTLQAEHAQYLERFTIDITEEAEELERIREQFGKPQNEIDPSTYLPKAVRLLLATLPLTEGRAFAINESGLPKLVDFGSIMNFMYKEFANTNPKDFKKNLERLVAKRPEIQILINRLNLDSDDISTLNENQIRLIVQTMMQFNQSNNTFYTQLMTREGGRRLINSNQNRVEDKIKLLWTNNFKENIQDNKGLGEDVNGELILNPKAKVKVGKKSKTFSDWAKDIKRTPQETLLVLNELGISFTRPDLFTELYIADENVRQASNYIFQTVYNEPVSNIFKGDIQANLQTLVNLEAQTNPTNVDLQHRNPEGKTIHGVNLKTYADVLISNLTKIGPTGEKIVNQEEVLKLLNYDNLKGSHYLRSLAEDPSLPLEVVILQGIEQSGGRGKVLSKGSPVDIGVMMVNSLLTQGITPILRTADKKTEFGIKYAIPSLMLSRQDMVARLQNYLADELRVASTFNSKRKSKLRRISTLKDNGGNLRFFKGLVPSIGRTEYGKRLDEKDIENIVNRENVILDLNAFLDSQILKTTNTFKEYNILDGLDQNLVERAQITEASIEEQFTYEYLTSVNEQGKLLLGDFALYSDLFKRTSGISGTKIYPTSDPTILNWMNDNMPNLLSNKEHTKNLRVSHRAAIKTEAPYLEQYMATLELMGMSPEFMNNVNDVYSNMEEFDGGGFITLDAYRSLLWRAGKWTIPQEEFYQKIARGKEITTQDMALIPPIKPQLFGPHVVENSRLMTFHKFALFPIIPNMGGLMPETSFDDINQDMIENDIDYMIFESAVKVGGVVMNEDGYDPFYEELPTGYSAYKDMELDEKGQPLGLQELSFSDLGIQVETAPKTKQTVREGSQSRSLLPINVYDRGELSEGYQDFEKLIDTYHEVNEELVARDFNNLTKKLKLVKDESGVYKLESDDIEEFKKVLIQEFKKRDNPLHTIAALEGLLESDTKFIEQLFEKNKIENLLYSIVNNNVVRREMPGGQFVLQASTGFEHKIKAIKQKDFELADKDGIDLHGNKLKPLKFYRKADPDNLSSETLAMQVYLPSRFKDQMGVLEEDINLVDPELLQLIGFRIPTEGLNSMDFIEVVGFLPKAYGDTVIVPSEIVGKAGSDYDIDKLSIYFPNSTKEGKRVKFDPSKSVKEQSKAALQNELQTIMRDVLSHPASFDQLISPVGASTLKEVAQEIAMLRNPNNFDLEGNKIKKNLSETLQLENMINTSYRMFSGLGGIGIVATSSTQHAKGQRPGLNWNFANNEDIVFNFAGEGFGLSSVYDIKGVDKISGTIGQYVTGYVDVTKEDFVFDINAGIEMAPIHMLLVRSGVPLKTVAYFMSQPIIDDYVKLKELNQPMYSFSPLLSNSEIESELTSKYGNTSSSNIKFTEASLRSMVGKDVTNLEDLEKRKQIQILNDFLRYKDLAEDLLILKDASSVDTSRLNNGISVRYVKQLINRLEQDGKFINLDELLYGNKEGASTVAAYTKLLNEIDGMFADFKLGEYLTDARQFIDNKLFELTDKDLKVNREDAINKMRKFENFLATTVVQRTSWEYNKLEDRGRDLFVGQNSLPRRINTLKKMPAYANNLLMQELTPILQVYTEDSVESTVDGLRLFSRKLQPYDIDLLADAFLELKEINPVIARELIIFSALQSGYEFSPTSFFQIIPGTEVLEVLSPYFKQNKNEDRTSNLINHTTINSLWDDFHKNYSYDSAVAPNIYRKNVYNNLTLNKNHNFVTVTTIVGRELIGSKESLKYDTLLYKNTGKVTDKGLSIYTKIDKKGVKNSFVEATGANTPSIINRNTGVIANKEEGDPEVSNTILTVKRNLNNEIQNVINEEDKGCQKT